MASSLQMFRNTLIAIAFNKVMISYFLIVYSCTWNSKWARENNTWLGYFSSMDWRWLFLFLISDRKNTLWFDFIVTSYAKSFLLVIIFNFLEIVLVLGLRLILHAKVLVVDAAFTTSTDRANSRWVIRCFIMKLKLWIRNTQVLIVHRVSKLTRSFTDEDFSFTLSNSFRLSLLGLISCLNLLIF